MSNLTNFKTSPDLPFFQKVKTKNEKGSEKVKINLTIEEAWKTFRNKTSVFVRVCRHLQLKNLILKKVW